MFSESGARFFLSLSLPLSRHATSALCLSISRSPRRRFLSRPLWLSRVMQEKRVAPSESATSRSPISSLRVSQSTTTLSPFRNFLFPLSVLLPLILFLLHTSCIAPTPLSRASNCHLESREPILCQKNEQKNSAARKDSYLHTKEMQISHKVSHLAGLGSSIYYVQKQREDKLQVLVLFRDTFR